MSRLLCIFLLPLAALPLFAQSESAQSVPANPALLMQMRDNITLELQQIHRLIGAINPNDTQFAETLKTQQADLTRQYRDIMQQLQQQSQTPNVPDFTENPQVPVLPASVSPRVMPVRELSNTPRIQQIIPDSIGQPDLIRQYPPVMPADPSSHNDSFLPVPMPIGQYYPSNQIPPVSPMGDIGTPPWLSQPQQEQSWESMHWGPRLPKELTEVKQTVDSLRKEVTELKETVKALEAQIQLLNRNFLLMEKIRENGH